jgi:hypothetical protein
MTLHRWSGLALLGWMSAFAIACGDDDDPDPGNSGGKSGGGSAGRGGSQATGGGDATGGRPAPTGGRASMGGASGTPGVAGEDSGGAGPEPTGGRAAGGSPSTGGSNDGGSTVEAGAGGSNASGGNATGGVATPSGGAPAQGAHIPDVTPTRTGEVFAGNSVEDFVVTESHYYVDGSPQSISDHYWLGVIVNDSDEMKCRLTVSVSLEAPGSAPVKFSGPVVAPMYRFAGLTNRVYCLAPGERGVAVAQPFEVAPQFAAEDVTAVTYGVAGEMAGDVVPAEWVQLGNVEIEDEGPRSRVTGDIENTSTAAVSSVVALVFPKNTAGAPLAYFRIADERASAPEGSVWHFESPFHDGNFEDADVFYEHGAPGAP